MPGVGAVAIELSHTQGLRYAKHESEGTSLSRSWYSRLIILKTRSIISGGR